MSKKLLFILQNPILIFTCAGLWARCSPYFKAYTVVGMTVTLFQRSKLRLPDPAPWMQS